jgi:hypothetical protein
MDNRSGDLMVRHNTNRSAGSKFWTSPLARVFYVATGLALVVYLVVYAPLPFVVAWWQPHPMSWDEYLDPLHKRARMADGLKLGGGLAGKTRTEVVALLGEPPATSYFSEYDLVYQLGRDRTLFGMDSDWLAIRFGLDGQVSEVDVLQD